jgi:hypothetical protein
MTTNAKTYFEMAKERAAALELDALSDGHAALMLQSQRLANRCPEYPRQPAGSPWAQGDPNPAPPLGYAIDQVADMTKVESR